MNINRQCFNPLNSFKFGISSVTHGLMQKGKLEYSERETRVNQFGREAIQEGINIQESMLAKEKEKRALIDLIQQGKIPLGIENNDDRDVILALVQKKPYYFPNIKKKFKADREILLTTIQSFKSATHLKYASKKLRNDKEFVLHLIKDLNFPDAIDYASHKLKNDKELVLLAISRQPYLIQCVNKKFRRDKEVMSAFAAQNGQWSLKFASKNLKKDVDFLRIAATEMIMKFISPETKKGEAFESAIQLKIEEILEENKKNNDSISFEQSDLCSEVSNNEEVSHTLKAINKKWKGLCEIICNKILIDDLLGKGDPEEQEFYDERITISELDQEHIYNSHIMYTSSFFQKFGAFAFGTYPDNIFSYEEQSELIQSNDSKYLVNRMLLAKGLTNIEDGTTLKLLVFNKNILSMDGHSLLIKKIKENEFIFFDPNSGEERDLTLEQVAKKIDNQLITCRAKHIYLTKGNDYLNRLREGGLQLNG